MKYDLGNYKNENPKVREMVEMLRTAREEAKKARLEQTTQQQLQ